MTKKPVSASIIWVIEAVPRLLWVAMRLRNSPSSWLQKQLMATTTKPDARLLLSDADQLRMHESVRIATRLLPGNIACLPRSLVLVAMLRQRGVPASMELGVEKQDDALVSHAWVTVAGKMIGEPERVASDFKALHDYKTPSQQE